MDKLINKLFPIQPFKKNFVEENKLYELNKEENKKFRRKLNVLLVLHKMQQDTNCENFMKTYYDLVYGNKEYIGLGIYNAGTEKKPRLMREDEYNNYLKSKDLKK